MNKESHASGAKRNFRLLLSNSATHCNQLFGDSIVAFLWQLDQPSRERACKSPRTNPQSTECQLPPPPPVCYALESSRTRPFKRTAAQVLTGFSSECLLALLQLFVYFLRRFKTQIRDILVENMFSSSMEPERLDSQSRVTKQMKLWRQRF